MEKCQSYKYIKKAGLSKEVLSKLEVKNRISMQTQNESIYDISKDRELSRSQATKLNVASKKENSNNKKIKQISYEPTTARHSRPRL